MGLRGSTYIVSGNENLFCAFDCPTDTGNISLRSGLLARCADRSCFKLTIKVKEQSAVSDYYESIISLTSGVASPTI